MANSFKEYLELVYAKLDSIMEKLNESHYKNTEFLNQKHVEALEKIGKYRDIVGDIISNFDISNPLKFYPKIEEIREMDESEIETEKKKWEFAEPVFKQIQEDFYKFDEIRVFKDWKAIEVDKCMHERRTVVVTYCKKAHCKICLKDIINSGGRKCPCNEQLSPKNFHEVMGFSYRIESSMFK